MISKRKRKNKARKGNSRKPEVPKFEEAAGQQMLPKEKNLCTHVCLHIFFFSPHHTRKYDIGIFAPIEHPAFGMSVCHAPYLTRHSTQNEEVISPLPVCWILSVLFEGVA